MVAARATLRHMAEPETPEARADAKKSPKTFEEWLPEARKLNPKMTDEQIRANWDAAQYIFGD